MSDETERTQMDKIHSLVVTTVNRDVLGKVTDTFSIRKTTELAASIDSALYYTRRMSKAAAMGSNFDLLRDAMQRRSVDGLVLEFGVASGSTVNYIATMTDQTVYGFDTFTGLPEDWRPGFARGAFAVPELPQVRRNVQLVIGMFEQTLPSFVQQHAGPISLIHVDCDLYSSTKTIFRNLAPWIVEGTVIVFDEYFNYPGWREHEYKAFKEFLRAFQVTYEYISFVDSHQQVAVRITSSGNSAPFAAAKRSTVRDQFLLALIERSMFTFGRSDGAPYTDSMRLLPDGSISGYSHPNEASWSIIDEQLVFRSQQGNATTIFDTIELADDGAVVLLGHFVAGGRASFIHRLATGAPVTSQFASVVRSNAPPTRPSNSIAVLVRTYQCDAKYRSLMAKLSAGREGFDLYAIVDETHGRYDPGGWPTIWHSADACRRLGLTQRHPDILRLCGDFPLYFALREIPLYQHYVMIEDDVELCGQDASFVVELCKILSDPARATTHFAGVNFQRDPHLIWGPASANIYTQEHCYLARFPFVVVSRQLCAYLFSQRQVEAARNPQREDLMHCEVFAPSAAMAGGFTCVDVNDLIPGCYDSSIMMLDVPGFALPMGAAHRGHDGIRMYHPVYTLEEWLERMRRRFSANSPEREEKLRVVAEDLAREEAVAREVGDKVMTGAIEKVRDLLGPSWLEFFDRQSGRVPLGGAS